MWWASLPIRNPVLAATHRCKLGAPIAGALVLSTRVMSPLAVWSAQPDAAGISSRTIWSPPIVARSAGSACQSTWPGARFAVAIYNRPLYPRCSDQQVGSVRSRPPYVWGVFFFAWWPAEVRLPTPSSDILARISPFLSASVFCVSGALTHPPLQPSDGWFLASSSQPARILSYSPFRSVNVFAADHCTST